MHAPRELLQQLLERRDLSEAQAGDLLAQLTDPELPPAMAGALLPAPPAAPAPRGPPASPSLPAPPSPPPPGGAARARAALGARPVSTTRGPLVTPAHPPLHLVGAFSLEVAGLMADTFQGLPIERAFVVHGAEGWDEPTPIGPFTMFDVRPGQVSRSVRSPEQYGLERRRPADLAGGNAAYNARSLEAVLSGQERGAHRDCLLLGTALALELHGATQDPLEGVARAAAAIDSGAARRGPEALRRGRS